MASPSARGMCGLRGPEQQPLPGSPRTSPPDGWRAHRSPRVLSFGRSFQAAAWSPRLRPEVGAVAGPGSVPGAGRCPSVVALATDPGRPEHWTLVVRCPATARVLCGLRRPTAPGCTGKEMGPVTGMGAGALWDKPRGRRRSGGLAAVGRLRGGLRSASRPSCGLSAPGHAGSAPPQ